MSTQKLAVLFKTAKIRKQPRGPSMSEWETNYDTFIQWNIIQ